MNVLASPEILVLNFRLIGFAFPARRILVGSVSELYRLLEGLQFRRTTQAIKRSINLFNEVCKLFYTFPLYRFPSYSPTRYS